MSDQMLTTIARVRAARSGISPDAFAAQQAVGQMARANALQDPALRGLIMQQPQLAGMLGLQTAPRTFDVGADGPGTGPSIVSDVPQLPAYDPESKGALERSLQSARAKYFSGSGFGGMGDTPDGLTLKGVTRGPSGPTYSYGMPEEVTAPEGSLDPSGQPYKTGDKSPTGRVIRVTPRDSPEDRAAQKAAAEAASMRESAQVDAKAVLDMIPKLRLEARKLLFTPGSSGNALGAIGQAILNRGAQAYQSNVTVPNALNAGEAPTFRTAVQKVIPLIRSAARSTKGLRITQAEFEKEGGPLTHPENLSLPDMESYLNNLEEDMKDVLSGKAFEGTSAADVPQGRRLGSSGGAAPRRVGSSTGSVEQELLQQYGVGGGR